MKSTIAALLLSLAVTPVLARDLYVTGSVGTDNDRMVSGIAVGVEPNKNLRVEAAYEHSTKDSAYAYVLPQYRIPTTALTPYLLAGYGADLRDPNKGKVALGGGLRVELTSKVDLDLRYRSLENIDTNRREDISTVGLSLRF